MKLLVNHYGRVRGGEVVWAIPDLYLKNLIELEGNDIVMTIKKRHQKPSNNQYNYYRGGILMTCYKSEFFSSLDSKDSIHELYFAPKFLSYTTIANIGGVQKEITRVKSLADINKDEINEFITKVLAECLELGIEILPSEMYYAKYYQK